VCSQGDKGTLVSRVGQQEVTVPVRKDTDVTEEQARAWDKDDLIAWVELWKED
jgi:hypothetical protein